MRQGHLDWIDAELVRLEEAQLRRSHVVRSAAQSARSVIDGRPALNFGSNDYLGLAADPQIVAAVCQAASRCGWGAGASPLVTGRGRLHAKLESELAHFEWAEAALLFTSGYAANVGTIASLVSGEDAVFSDAKNHASIIDGCRLSGATVEVYRHADVDHLHRLLQDAPRRRRALIVSDGLFSMDGDLAPLAQLAELADRYGCMLMVDEAHATGVFGAKGRGVSEYLGVEPAVDVRVGTLSKALGSLGGFVTGQQRLIDWLANRARSYVFSTALPEATCAAALQALEIVRDQPQRRQLLLDRAASLRQHLRQRGWNVGNSQSQIVPVRVGDPVRTMQLATRLLQYGCFVPGIRPPSVPAGESLLRISLCYGHDENAMAQLEDGLQACMDSISKP